MGMKMRLTRKITGLMAAALLAVAPGLALANPTVTGTVDCANSSANLSVSPLANIVGVFGPYPAVALLPGESIEITLVNDTGSCVSESGMGGSFSTNVNNGVYTISATATTMGSWPSEVQFGSGFSNVLKLKVLNAAPVTFGTVSAGQMQSMQAGGPTFRNEASVYGNTNLITYSSSDTNVATVSSNGTVTALAAGSATITATRAREFAAYAETSINYTVNVAAAPQPQATLTVSAGQTTLAPWATTTLSTSGGSGTGAVTYSVVDLGGGCFISGSNTLNAGPTNGTCEVTATKAADASFQSATSAAITITVATPATVPAAPTNLVASAGSSNTRALISFTPGSNGGSAITSYEYRLISGGMTNTAVGTTSPIDINLFTDNVTHQVAIRAVNAVGAGAWSSPLPVMGSALQQQQQAAPVTISSVVPDANGLDIEITLSDSFTETGAHTVTLNVGGTSYVPRAQGNFNGSTLLMGPEILTPGAQNWWSVNVNDPNAVLSIEDYYCSNNQPVITVTLTSLSMTFTNGGTFTGPQTVPVDFSGVVCQNNPNNPNNNNNNASPPAVTATNTVVTNQIFNTVQSAIWGTNQMMNFTVDRFMSDLGVFSSFPSIVPSSLFQSFSIWSIFGEEGRIGQGGLAFMGADGGPGLQVTGFKLDADDDGAILFSSASYMDVSNGWRRVGSAELNFNDTQGVGSSLSLNGRMSWERYADATTLYGYFLSGTLRQSQIEGGYSGDQDGWGLQAGGYMVARGENGLIGSTYAMLGFNSNDLDIGDGTTRLTDSYASRSLMLGAALSGDMEYAGYRLRPSLAANFAQSSIGTLSVTQTVNNAATQLSVPVGTVRLFEVVASPQFLFAVDPLMEGHTAGELSVAPRLTCERRDSGTDSRNCGAGLSLGVNSNSADGLTAINAGVSLDRIGDETRRSLRLQAEMRF